MTNQDDFIRDLKRLSKHEKNVGKATVYTLMPQRMIMLSEGSYTVAVFQQT